jgi:hypothetical protein
MKRLHDILDPKRKERMKPARTPKKCLHRALPGKARRIHEAMK